MSLTAFKLPAVISKTYYYFLVQFPMGRQNKYDDERIARDGIPHLPCTTWVMENSWQ